jgi:hypothetical protein
MSVESPGSTPAAQCHHDLQVGLAERDTANVEPRQDLA